MPDRETRIAKVFEDDKSSRYRKVIGDFGEPLVCNWLSRTGFETVLADQIGIDVIAYRPRTRSRLGIFVKSRTRKGGGEREAVNLFNERKRESETFRDACKAFGLEPWLAVYVETTREAHLYVTPLQHYEKTYCSPRARVIRTWKMGEEDRQRYLEDAKVKSLHFDVGRSKWSWL